MTEVRNDDKGKEPSKDEKPRSRRLFIGVPLSEDLRTSVMTAKDSLIASDSTLETRVSWESPEKLHWTIRFLGSTSENVIEALIKGLEEQVSGLYEFPIAVGGLGGFPNKTDARVVWLDGKPISPGKKGDWEVLASQVDSVVDGMGLWDARDHFTPHLTLGRKARGGRGGRRGGGRGGGKSGSSGGGKAEKLVLDGFGELKEVDDVGVMVVNSLAVFESFNGEYRVLHRVTLSKRDDEE